MNARVKLRLCVGQSMCLRRVTKRYHRAGLGGVCPAPVKNKAYEWSPPPGGSREIATPTLRLTTGGRGNPLFTSKFKNRLPRQLRHDPRGVPRVMGRLARGAIPGLLDQLSASLPVPATTQSMHADYIS